MMNLPNDNFELLLNSPIPSNGGGNGHRNTLTDPNLLHQTSMFFTTTGQLKDPTHYFGQREHNPFSIQSLISGEANMKADMKLYEMQCNAYNNNQSNQTNNQSPLSPMTPSSTTTMANDSAAYYHHAAAAAVAHPSLYHSS